jgi:hypothetical protein
MAAVARSARRSGLLTPRLHRRNLLAPNTLGPQLSGYFGRPFGERFPESVRGFSARHLTSEPVQQEWETVRTAMPCYFFVWTPEVVAHSAEHDVTMEEFEEVVTNPRMRGCKSVNRQSRGLRPDLDRPASLLCVQTVGGRLDRARDWVRRGRIDNAIGA